VSTPSEWEKAGRRVSARLERIPDPDRRAVAAGRELEELTAQVKVVYEIRLRAIAELRSRGLSYAKIGALLDVHRARVAQMHKDIVARGLSGQ